MNNESDLDRFLFTFITLAVILGSVTAFLFMLSMQERPTYSAVYLKPNSYTNFLADSSVEFTYGIQNNESLDMNYLVRFVSGNKIIKSGTVFLKKGASIEKNELLELEEIPSVPFKMRIILSSGKEKEKNSEAFFWIKG